MPLPPKHIEAPPRARRVPPTYLSVTATMTRARTFLLQARRARRLIRFRNPFEVFPVKGYVLDVGPRFFLLAVVNDRVWFDGFECFRVSDVRKPTADPYTDFVEAALRKRGERRAARPRVDVTSIEKLLLSAGRCFPLVTIHREKIDPDVCHIGRVTAVRGGEVSLLEISPNATWDHEPTTYRLREITRVGFGADYENALHLVAGRR